MAQVDAKAKAILARTGVPSASIAVVRGGQIAYLQAYGEARPGVPATARARYAIGSISKQFTAAAVLLLAEDRKLGLDDPLEAYVPGLTGGPQLTIRQVLNMTAGYRDYWPQDYAPPEMTRPTTTETILTRWARNPLDFKPGEEWQYSNTSYTIAGQVVEEAGGKPLMGFLTERIFAPLGMDTVANLDAAALPAPDAQGFTRYGLGPVRPAPKEGERWLYAIGDLAMNPRDLAVWDISLINRTLLKPASYKEMQRTARLTNGTDTGYGLGVHVSRPNGRLLLSHGGEISGFLAENRVWPEEAMAVVVLTNADFGGAQTAIADAIQDVLFPDDDDIAPSRQLFDLLRAGKVDRRLLTPNAAAYFTPEALADIGASLGPLGEPKSFVLLFQRKRGGLYARRYEVSYPDGRRLSVIEYRTPRGRIEQFLVQAAD